MLLPCRILAQSVVIKKQAPAADSEITMHDFRYQAEMKSANPLVTPFNEKPGLALLSSAVIPGLGQATNGKWLRAGAYIVAEVALLAVHFKNINAAHREERKYKQFAEDNWSVVTYAKWLDNYYEQNGIVSPAMNALREQIAGVDPAYNHDTDWNVIDIELLRNVERNTPFFYPDRTGNNFSHTMPAYGSQQYFELISKYFQYGPGWRDFGTDPNGEALDSLYQLNWNGTDMPPNFIQGSVLAANFNSKYRIAGNMLSLLVLNHIVSAFDAFLTVKIKNNRLKAEADLLKPEMFSLKYHF